MKVLYFAVFGLIAAVSATSGVFAQERTPPKTSVRALEAPIDYRHKQFRRYHPRHQMYRHHAY